MESGLATQIGFKAESTYGTRVAPTRFLELVSESVSFDPGRRESKAIKKDRRVLGSSRWAASKKEVSGSVEFPLLDAGLGLLLQHALGTVASAQPAPGTDPTVWEHTLTIGDTKGLSLTTQIGRASTDGTVNPFDYLGCKVSKWTIAQAIDDDGMLTLDLDGQDEDTSQSLASASYIAGTGVLGWDFLAVTVDGVAFNTSSFEVSGDNALKTDRYFAGARTKKEPLANALVDVSGTIEGEFVDTTAYELVRSGSVVAITAFWTGPIISNAYHRAIEITIPACRIDSETPNVGGPDEIPQKLTFKALDNGTDEPITIVYRTTDTTP